MAGDRPKAMNEKQKRLAGIAGAAMMVGGILWVLGDVWKWLDNIFVDIVVLLLLVVVLVCIRSYRKVNKERKERGEAVGKELWSINWKQLLSLGAMLAIIATVTLIRYRATGGKMNPVTDVYIIVTIAAMSAAFVIWLRYIGRKKRGGE